MIVSIICVNYNSYKSLEKYLLSLQHALDLCNDISLTVYIADNSTKKEEICVNVNYNINTFLYNNLGYFGGAFEVINTQEEIKYSDYVIISNVDLQVDINFFKELKKAKIDSDTGWIAPRIYSEITKTTKSYRLKFQRPDKKKILLLLLSFKFPFIQNIYIKTSFRNKQRKSIEYKQQYIYSGHGSFIILTKRFFNLNEDIKLKYEPFLYGEEYFLAELIRKRKLKAEYIPELLILDDEHISTGNLPSKMFYKYNYIALKYLYFNFFRGN